jgi:xanthine dehydrogenase YagR molybdenum-binding subunit
MTAASCGSAIHEVATALRARLASLRVDLADVDRCRSVAVANGGHIEVRADAEPPDDETYARHTFGAVFAEVRVDADLGTVRVARIVGAYAAGRVLNRKTARSQYVGAITYGLAMALHEHTAIDPRTGRYLNADLAEYLVPVNADIADIDVIIVDEQDDHLNPIGVKGLGELATTGVAAAVANAVYHATGVRVRDLPITVDKVLGLTLEPHGNV